MPSPHWAEVRFLVPPLSKWRAISSDMKVFKSTSWSPFLLRLPLEPLLTWVGEPGVLERTLMLAIAPLRPRGGREKHSLPRKAALVTSRVRAEREVRGAPERQRHPSLCRGGTQAAINVGH